MTDIIVAGDNGTEAIIQTAVPVQIIVDGALKGDAGDDGAPGVGVPTGGSAGQVLLKNSNTDYDTEWGALAPTSVATPTNSGIVKQTVYNVLDYGATGNGSTDDTTSIQNAINAANTAGGGTVYFPIGVYKLTAALIGHSNIWYLGASASQTTNGGACLNQTGANLDAIRFTNTTAETTNVTITNLRIQGLGATSGNGIYFKNTGSGGNHPPFTYIDVHDVYIANFNGVGAYGLNIEGAIVSEFHNIVAETCYNGFFLNGAAGGTNYSTLNTSVKFANNYADGCQNGIGFNIKSTAYSSFDNCAADSCGVAYSLDHCNAVAFSACGSEWGSSDTATPGDGFKINASSQVTMLSPYTYQVKHVSFWSTGASQGITLIGAQENTPNGATYSIEVDAGAEMTLINQNTTTAVHSPGVLSYLDDGGGDTSMPGTLYIGKSGYFGGMLTAGLGLTVVGGNVGMTAASGGTFSLTDQAYINALALTTPLPIGSGGTGSATKNFVDMTTAQTIAGIKTFSNNVIIGNLTMASGTGGGQLTGSAGGTLSITDQVYISALALTTALPITSGGTGSATKNFVDLIATQTVAGAKTFSNLINGTAGINITAVGGGSLSVSDQVYANALSLTTALPVASGGTGVATSTGTGATVRSNSPALVTPALGTPTALVLTNATALPISGISATGTPSSTTYLRGDGAWATVSSGFANPMTTAGDIIYGAAAGAATRLATGTGLLHAGTTPTWSLVSLTADISGTLPVANGGTGIVALGTGVATAMGVAVNGSGALSLTNSPAFTTPNIGVAVATSVNKLIITAPTTSATLTLVTGSSLVTVGAFPLTLTSTAATTATFPAGTHTLAALDVAQTFTATQTFPTTSSTLFLEPNNAITVTTNAGTADVLHGFQTFTNSSAAAMAITLATAGAADGQTKIIRIYDFSAVAEAITWVNTENSTVAAPIISNGSLTLHLTVGFIYNSATSKWRCIAVA